MFALQSLEMSNHCKYDRKNRLELIETKIGWGQIIKKTYFNNCYHFLTDTGIIAIVDDKLEKIITIYLANVSDLLSIYNGYKKIPPFLLKKVQTHINHGYANIKRR